MASRDVERLVDAQARQRERIHKTASDSVGKLIAGWSDFYTPAAVRRLIDALIRIIEPAQERTASTTDAYLARVIGEMRGRASAPVGVRIDPAQLRGTSHRDVVERIAAEYRYQVSEGLDDAEARQRATRRARLIVDEDVSLAQREATRQVYTRTKGIRAYRRVIRPEMSAGGTCGLCVAASDQRYATDQLLPIHARCKCETLPIIGSSDPGRSLNRSELDELYERAGGTAAEVLKRTRYQVNEHGELGPVLGKADEHFKGPSDVAAETAA